MIKMGFIPQGHFEYGYSEKICDDFWAKLTRVKVE